MTKMFNFALLAMLVWATTAAETCDVCMELKFEDGTYAEGYIPCSDPHKDFQCPEDAVCTTFTLAGILDGQSVAYKIADCSLPSTDCDVVKSVMHSYTSLKIKQCEKGTDVWGLGA